MSLLTIIQRVCTRTNVPVPATVYGSTEPLVLQMLALLEEEGNDLSQRHPWQGVTFEATLTSLAAEDQGAMATIASNGFRHIKNQTFWDRSSKLPILGPLSDVEWQTRKAVTNTGPRYSYRIRGGKLLINPVPTAGLTWAFEYISKNWILGIDGTTYKQYFTLDTDTILVPEELVLMGLRWRWKKEKGRKKRLMVEEEGLSKKENHASKKGEKRGQLLCSLCPKDGRSIQWCDAGDRLVGPDRPCFDAGILLSKPVLSHTDYDRHESGF